MTKRQLIHIEKRKFFQSLSKKRFKKILIEDVEKIIELYKEGYSSPRLAKKFNINPSSIRSLLNRREISTKPKKIAYQLADKIILLYKEGYSTRNIAKKFDIGSTTVGNILKENNILRRNSSESKRIYKINENFFDDINTEEKAYFLGFLYGDGYNNEKKRTVVITLKSEDREILEIFTKILQPNKPLKEIKRKINNNITRYYTKMLIFNKHISQKLAELGCMQAKSFKNNIS